MADVESTTRQFVGCRFQTDGCSGIPRAEPTSWRIPNPLISGPLSFLWHHKSVLVVEMHSLVL
jgi:hypothetical protein